MSGFNLRKAGPLSLTAMPALMLALLNAPLASAQCTSCVNAITLPSVDVGFSTEILNQSPTSTLASTDAGLFALTLTGVGSGFSITNQTYTAWCAGWYNSPFSTSGSPGSLVVSTYSPSFPASAGPIVAGNTINMVNYILNNKQGTVEDVQDAIWLIMTGQTSDTPSATANAMVTAAKQNPSYIPNALGTVAVFYESGPTTLPTTFAGALGVYQSLFFEVPVPSVSQQGGGCSGCVSSVVLPATAAFSTDILDSNPTTDVAATSGKGFFNMTLTGVGAGYSITNQTYIAWCFGWYNSPFNTSGAAGYSIYNTYAANYPTGYGPLASTGNNINEINYILNHKAGTVQDVQNAIWYIETGFFETNSTFSQLSTAAQNMVSGALANPTYCPPTGGIIGLVLGTGSNPLATSSSAALGQYQNMLIEITCTGSTTGGGGTPPTISMKKTASTAKCNPFQKVTYTYVVTNNSTTVTLKGIVVTDDNGTPDTTMDDFTVGTIASLAPGASATLTASIYPPITESGNYDEGWGLNWGWSQWNPNWNFDYNNQIPGGTLICKDQGNGKIQFIYRVSQNLTDNTYGSGSSANWGWWGHSFSTLAGNDGAEFQVLDSTGKCTLDFVADYISPNPQCKSGWGTLGVKGGGGYVYSGNGSNVLCVDTSLSHNINHSSKYFGCTQNSPVNDPEWNNEHCYTVTVNAGAACGSQGFGGIRCPIVSNNPSKYWGCNNRVTKPVSSTVTNTATAAVVYNGSTIKTTAQATVTIDASPQGWSQCGKY